MTRVRYVYFVFDTVLVPLDDDRVGIHWHFYPWRLVGLLSTIGLGLALVVLGM